MMTSDLHNLLVSKKLTVSTAESLTGGMIGAALTSRSGSSVYFKGSIVAYTLEAKVALLGVDRVQAEACNCVSEGVAEQMALGVRDLFQTDCSIGVTGYAETSLEGEFPLPYAYCVVTCGPIQVKGVVRGPGLARTEMRELVTQTVLRKLTELVMQVTK